MPELNFGRVKFVTQNTSGSVTAPIETMSKGRIYAVLNSAGDLSNITFYVNGKRIRQIDLNHYHNGMKPHTHRGYFHDERGTRNLNNAEQKIVDKILTVWNNRNNT